MWSTGWALLHTNLATYACDVVCGPVDQIAQDHHIQVRKICKTVHFLLYI